MDELRPDCVKLDVGLVREAERYPDRAPFASEPRDSFDRGYPAVRVVAEEQWYRIAAHGVDPAHGYLFASPAFPPVPAHA